MYCSGTFMVLLVLELATLTQVDAFTIRRAPETTQLPDLIQSENAILEVRNDLRRNAEWKTSTSTETTAGTETQKNVVTEEITVTSVPTNATTITTAQTSSAASPTATPAVSTIQATVATTTEARNTTTTPTTTTTKTTITSITSSTEEPTQETSEPSSSTTETTEHTSETSSVITSSSTTEGTSEATSEDQTQASTNDNLVNQTFSSAKLQNVTVPGLNKTADNSTTVADKNITIQTTTPSKPETENVTTSSNQNFSTTEEWRTDTDNATSYSTESVDTSSSSSSAATTDATTDTSSSKDIDGTSHKETTDTVKIPTTSSSESETNVTEMTTVTETEGVSTETPKTNQSDGLKADSSGVTATPYWKKYTVIERKRNATVADPVTSTESDDMVQAGTAQSSVSLEKALNISSDIPSLEELKNELLALNKMTTLSLEKLSSMVTDSPITFSSPEDLSTISSETTSEVTTRLDVVSSKRAGFLDHSSRATIATEKVTSQKADGTTERVQTEKNIPVNKTTPLLAKSSSMASQSQLAEDAINEELMKEEILSDNVEYTQRQRVSTEGSNTLQRQSSEQSSSEGSNEDKLSVKPISAERAKNGGLYTVSPNYKPLKKIEVQPSKQFVRDPDDNSWRIQGLNSLGIVVKANNNNSSKPFTQVLKNKTESELNLLEKYNKGEEPELRERLEKIAEMRKSKKKKINQFGETVYTDYADSAERVTMGSGLFGDVVTTAKEVKEYTTTGLPELDYNKQTVTTTMEMDDELETTTITKAKKVIDDYEPDDDEPDYTLPDIDLKKQITIKSRVPPPSPPPSLQTTMRTYLPDRKPTIQYFPPREKPKVVINDYDTDFQRKVNAYTYNDAPMRVTQPLTVTAPSQPSYQFPRNKYDQHRPNDLARPAVDVNKNVYLTQPAPPQYNLVEPEGGNRASYVIKHLRDFIDDAVKTDDSVVTEVPVRGVTSNDAVRQTKGRPPSDYYDYEAQFRKDVLDKFVDNFNQNSERFKVEFPVVYNTSVVHTQLAAEGGQASSAAFMKRLYEDAQAIQRAGRLPKRFEPACERTVELSPAYELHYYVPEEEEKETADPRAPHPPPPPPPHQLYRFRL